MKKILIVLALVLLAVCAFTQTAPDILWTQTYGSIRNRCCKSMQQTIDNGFILAGGTHSIEDSYDFYLMKTDVDGNELWNQTYGGIEYDLCNSVIQTSDGGFVLAGYTSSYGAGAKDFWLLKTDAEGNELWNQTYGGSNHDVCHAMQQTTDGGFVLAGYTSSYGAGQSDGWLVKTDAEGNELWNQTYGGTADNRLYSMQQAMDGGYVLAGRTSEDFWVVRASDNGNAIWAQIYTGSATGSYDAAYTIKEIISGGFIFAGVSCFGMSNWGGYFVVKIDVDGNQIWNGSYVIDNFFQETYCHSIQEISAGNYVFAGESGYNNIQLCRLAPEVQVDFIADITEENAPLEVNFTDLSTDNVLEWQWDFQNDGTIDSYEQNPTYIYDTVGIYSVCLTVTDSISERTELKENYITVNAVSADEYTLSVTNELIDNYPNPFNGATTISFSLTAEHAENAEIEVYNMKGQKVENLPITNSLNQQIIWNANNFASGVYFYKLMVDGNPVDTKKMILLK